MGNKELTAPESSWMYSHAMSSFFKYCGILTCYILAYDFVFFKLARKKIAICQRLPLACQEIQYAAIHLIYINIVRLDKKNKKQQKQAVEQGVR